MLPILFVHGGADNAYRFDLEIIQRLQRSLGDEFSLGYPRIAGLERIEWQPTFSELSQQFAKLTDDATVIAHSIGGAAVLKLLLSPGIRPIRNLFLLAAPYKAADSHWGEDDFSFPNEFAKRLNTNLRIFIYHSKDDDAIPVGDALCYQQKLPTAQVHLLDGYGHQFSGPLDFLVNDIRSVTGRYSTDKRH
jgi:predicted alpha/beta hydrolase family esterase